MKQGYTIRIEANHPEFDCGKELQEGVQADGFLLLIVRDGAPVGECIYGVSVNDLAKFFDTDSTCHSALLQAHAIAKGIRKARKIRRKMDKKEKRSKAVIERFQRAIDEEKNGRRD